MIQFAKTELIKRILAPGDLSLTSPDGIDQALNLAIPGQAEILIIFVIEPIQRTVPPLLIKRQQKAAAEKLDVWLPTLSRAIRNAGPKCTSASLSGHRLASSRAIAKVRVDDWSRQSANRPTFNNRRAAEGLSGGWRCRQRSPTGRSPACSSGG